MKKEEEYVPVMIRADVAKRLERFCMKNGFDATACVKCFIDSVAP
ncbi:MAG TPA: hypothetical protein O0X39_02405 [Methanocorpusculum sp.]|nr:hypothetical protein [Methanocorpusculum sp.]